MIFLCVGVCSDLLQDLRLLLQAAVQVTASVHGEVLDHHLVDEFLQLTQLGAQMSEGRTNREADMTWSSHLFCTSDSSGTQPLIEQTSVSTHTDITGDFCLLT